MLMHPKEYELSHQLYVYEHQYLILDYHQQSSAKKEKKAAGTMYFYKKMAF